MAVTSLPTPGARPSGESDDGNGRAAVGGVAGEVAAGLDVDALVAALRAAVRGEVRFSVGDRALYSTDASNYRQPPIGVVIPRDIDDVVSAVAVCHAHGAPIFSRGGGTSLGGQCTNAAVMLDMAKHVNKVESVDARSRTAIVQAGVILDEVNKVARRHGDLVVGPKPATHNHCTIGGMLGNNSCGSTEQWSGTTAANVRRLEILTYDGVRMWVGATSDEEYAQILAEGGRRAQIYRELRALRAEYADAIRNRYPRLPRRISGYNLPDLLVENGFHVARALVGSESTCVTILRAEIDLLPEPQHVCEALIGYPDIVTAAAHVPRANSHQPYVLEALDHRLLRYEQDRRLNTVALHDLPDVGAWLMIKVFGDDDQAAHAAADRLARDLRDDGDVLVDRVYQDKHHIKEFDSVREAALGATSRVSGYPDAWPGWEDSAVPPDQLAGYLRDLAALLHEFGYGAAALYGHFGHGCVHTSIPFDLTTDVGLVKFRSFVTRAARLVVSHGGSLSGEHGDGQARGELLPVMFGDELVSAMARFKAIFDPHNRMNPGKVIAPNPLDRQLRLGVEWPPPRPATHFAYPQDPNGFSGVPTRCFGVGACRRVDTSEGGVMCPSFQVTREEKHSTRGRMRLLFEMMRGETIVDGWRSVEVHDALDLCLACKGCKSDCPVSVDVATYKAEFLSHHYQGRLRPRTHYSLGWLPVMARLAAAAPGLANAATHLPAVSRLAKSVAGVDRRRSVPRFAPVRFVELFRRRKRRPRGTRGQVVLWPDTFTNNLQPRIAVAAAVAMEAAGFEVLVPRKTVCCGLTWISTGQLATARRVLERTLRIMAPYLDGGLPVVALEPSCASVLRGDAEHLIKGGGADDPADARMIDLAAKLRKQTVTFAELLERRAPDFAPRLRGGAPGAVAGGGSGDGYAPIKAIVQKHCHQHAILGYEADQAVMRRVGLDPDVLESGCCGLAGDFGMSPEHRDVSYACAERVLYPAVREAGPDTLVIADGFSCRYQIASGAVGHRAVHLAEVVAAAVGQSESEVASSAPSEAAVTAAAPVTADQVRS